MAVRPYWSGQIRLSLVSLPVNVYSALNRTRHIPLHEIDRNTGQRIHHQNVAEDKPVAREDIIKGYEYEKGEYVLLEPEEISALKLPSKKTLEIVQFVDAKEIDPAYFESPYFVAPDGKGGEGPFAVIRDALRDSGKVGIGQLVISGRERLCSLKPYGRGLLLETLRYRDEIRAAEPYFADIGDAKVDKEELDLARELIKRRTAKFEPEKFHDHYREALQELINAKLEHRAPQPVMEERPTGKVVNLMDALRKSLNSDMTQDNVPKEARRRSGKARAKPAPKSRGKSTSRRRTG